MHHQTLVSEGVSIGSIIDDFLVRVRFCHENSPIDQHITLQTGRLVMILAYCCVSHKISTLEYPTFLEQTQIKCINQIHKTLTVRPHPLRSTNVRCRTPNL